MSLAKFHLPPLLKGLSARLLVLTIFFVMLAEVLIYAPSIGRYRKVYLEDRLGAAHLAILSLEASPEGALTRALEDELLDHVRAYAVELQKAGDPKQFMLGREMPPPIDASFDLRRGSFFGFIGNAFVSLAETQNRVIRVRGMSPRDPSVFVEVVLDEAPMRMAMIDYSERILVLSIVISVLTAALVYLSLRWLMVNPMRLITESMTGFAGDPEDSARVIVPGRRTDEIGVAQRALADMQRGLRAALRQRGRLAALGAAVTRINHDLRNILATARLISDRLATLEDPEVQRVVPTLVGTLDRAVRLCAQTLDFARAEQPPATARFDFAQLVDDVGEALGLDVSTAFEWRNEVGRTTLAEADRDQMFRVLTNLGANAVQAGARTVTIRAEPSEAAFVASVADDGPGLAAEARPHLFEPFAGSGRQGGTGLGLAIARDLMRANGGDIELARSGADGTVFRLSIPGSKAA